MFIGAARGLFWNSCRHMFSASRRNVRFAPLLELHLIRAREIQALERVARAIERQRAERA